MANQNTKEVVVALLEFTCEIAKVSKDGIQTSDALVLWASIQNNEDLKAKFIAAFDEIKSVPEEIKNMSWEEKSELAIALLTYLPKLINAFKK